MSEQLQAGRHLDALVAEKLMGLRVINNPLEYGLPFVLREGAPDSIPIQADNQLPLPKYSTDIQDAFQVIEQSNAFFEMFNNPRKGIWVVKFEGGSALVANSAPLAICLAALKAIRAID